MAAVLVDAAAWDLAARRLVADNTSAAAAALGDAPARTPREHLIRIDVRDRLADLEGLTRAIDAFVAAPELVREKLLRDPAPAGLVEP